MPQGEVPVTGTRAGLRRLGAGQPVVPNRAPALSQPGGDPAGKRRTAMGLVDGHADSATARTAFGQITGVPPGTGAPPGDTNPPLLIRRLAPESGVLTWLQARRPILDQGPQGTGDLSQRALDVALAPVDRQFAAAVEVRVNTIRAALDRRAADLPEVPVLGAGLPPPDRAEQLRLTRERVREDVEQFAEMARFATETNDRALADELAALARSNTRPGGVWDDPRAYTLVWGSDPPNPEQPGIVPALVEHFATPRSLAGEVNRALVAFQRQQLAALETALASAAPDDRIAAEFNAHVYWAYEAPDPNGDPFDRYVRILTLAQPAGDQLLELRGRRLVATSAAKPGPPRTVVNPGPLL